MEIKDSTVMVFGGAGLVGMAVCRKILEQDPKELVLLALTKEEVQESGEILRSDYSNSNISYDWGNIFVRSEYKDKTRSELLSNSEYRKNIIHDLINDLNEDILSGSYLFKLIEKYKPDIIIDCINTATGVAYQNIFLSSLNTIRKSEAVKTSQDGIQDFIDEVEKLLCIQYIPQLIRHIQILYEAARRFNTKFYFKIGTSGTGGMGLNIPYTHSEERPSRVLLSKSSIAGAHSLLLFLMARTPDAPIIKEIKPAAAIAWKRIHYGKILRKGKPIPLFDCAFDSAVALSDVFELKSSGGWEKIEGKYLEAPYIDTGENGMFSSNEFMTITSIGQMEFVTPEEIAENLMFEIKGGNTGHDIIDALDSAAMGPTYRAGAMRDHALNRLKSLELEHGSDIVAFEILGPPRLSKLLYEAHLLKRICSSMNTIVKTDEHELSHKIEELLKSDVKLRSAILSIGIPILTADGKRLVRGETIKIPPFREKSNFEVSDKNIDKWAHDGWIDLRPGNMRGWKRRFSAILNEIENMNPEDTSSHYQWSRDYWIEHDDIEIGKVVAWIFVNEDKGLRMKN